MQYPGIRQFIKENIMPFVAMVMEETKIQQLLSESCSSEILIFNLFKKRTFFFKWKFFPREKVCKLSISH